MMNFEWWLTLRYLTAKKDKFLSVINFVAIAGIAIGVMALIIVIGVMTGFDHDLRENRRCQRAYFCRARNRCEELHAIK